MNRSAPKRGYSPRLKAARMQIDFCEPEEPKKSSFIPSQPARVRSFHPGSTWLLAESKVVVQRLLSSAEAMVMHIDNGHVENIAVSNLDPIPDRTVPKRPAISPEDHKPEVWDRGVKLEEALRAFVESGDRSSSKRRALASQLGMSDRNLQRKLKRYDALRTVTAVLPERRGPTTGSTLLRDDVEVLLRKEIERNLKVSPSISARELHGLLAAQLPKGSRAPGLATVSRRLREMRANLDLLPSPIKEEAKYRVKPLQHRAKAQMPLELVQIDHTVVDVHVIHPITGHGIGRPVLTLMIDESTKVILGMYLSLEAPSRLSVGMCLLHGVLPKDKWLVGLGIPDAIWPGYGLLRILFSDNGSDFHAMSLRVSCEEFGMSMQFRPPNHPAIGGLIERTIGTMMSRVRLLPGASYSEVLKKAPKRADKLARMTLDELEHYLALQISIYHQTSHSALGMTPSRAWELAWKVNGVVTSPRIPDADAFRLTFLPGEWRVVSRGTVKLWTLLYGCPQLHDVSGSKLVRYDPRDMSRVYVQVDSGFITVELLDPQIVPFSLWEFKALRSERRRQGAPQSAQLSKDLLAARDLREEVAKRSTRLRDGRQHARQLEWEKTQSGRTPRGTDPAGSPPIPDPSGCRVEGDE